MPHRREFNPVPREVVGPRGEVIDAVSLNGHIVTLPSKLFTFIAINSCFSKVKF